MLDSLSKDLERSRAFEDVMREFAARVSADSKLQDRLTEAVEGGVPRDEFCKLYVDMAKEQGFDFTVEQMEVAMQEQKQGKDKVLPTSVQKLITVL